MRYTQAQIEQLTGRDLDAAVCEVVFGWRWGLNVKAQRIALFDPKDESHLRRVSNGMERIIPSPDGYDRFADWDICGGQWFFEEDVRKNYQPVRWQGIPYFHRDWQAMSVLIATLTNAARQPRWYIWKSAFGSFNDAGQRNAWASFMMDALKHHEVFYSSAHGVTIPEATARAAIIAVVSEYESPRLL